MCIAEDQFELFPGISQYDTDKLNALGFSDADIQRMVGHLTTDILAEIAADEAIDDASVIVEAEEILRQNP